MSGEVSCEGRGRLLQLSRSNWGGKHLTREDIIPRDILSPPGGASPPRGILVSRGYRSDDFLDSDDLDTESSILVSKLPTALPGGKSSRRSRSATRAKNESQKKTTFNTRELAVGSPTPSSTRSSSSVDVSRISFQGKRALFDQAARMRDQAATPKQPTRHSNLPQKVKGNATHSTSDNTSQPSFIINNSHLIDPANIQHPISHANPPGTNSWDSHPGHKVHPGQLGQPSHPGQVSNSGHTGLLMMQTNQMQEINITPDKKTPTKDDLVATQEMMEIEMKKLEQTAALREEIGRRLSRKLEEKEKVRKENETVLEEKVQSLEGRLAERESLISDMKEKLIKLQERLDENLTDHTEEEILYNQDESQSPVVACRFNTDGCPFNVPSVRAHEQFACSFRPTRCPSLTCSDRPAAALLSDHVTRMHDGTTRGKDVVARTGSNQLVSSYVNVDREPVFYKTSRMSWVASELVCGGERFYVECVREPPEWHLWVWHAGPAQPHHYTATIRLFKVGPVEEDGPGVSRSWTGEVIPLAVSREEIIKRGLGFMVNDKQVKPLCGPIQDGEEQLFGYEVIVDQK